MKLVFFVVAFLYSSVCCFAIAHETDVAVSMPTNVLGLLQTFDGRTISDAETWEGVRRPELKNWLLKKMYCGYPCVAGKGAVSFWEEGRCRAVMEGRAVRKCVRIVHESPCSSNAFVVTAVIPRRESPAPAFVLIGAGDGTGGVFPVEEIISRGYAAIAFGGQGFADGRNGAGGKERPLALAWRASRVMDWIATESTLDARHIAVVGHPCCGIAALLAGAADERFAMTCQLDDQCGDASLGDGAATRLAALVAPRLLAVGADCQASPVWGLYGRRGSAVSGGSVLRLPRNADHGPSTNDWSACMDFADAHGWKTGDNLSAFRKARFGLFVHWGLYAMLGGRWKGETMDYIGEWVQSRFRIPNAEYAALAKDFNPTGFDADEWIGEAKDAGMAYLVFTSKHHEGFAMFDTAVSDYSIVHATPFKRDPLKELSAACRRQGMKFGFYYSQCLDWHERDAADVPEFRLTNKGMDWGNTWDWPDASQKDIGRYLKAKVYPQLRELLTNYGDVFSIWFDCGMGMSLKQTWALRDYVRSLQPKAVVNSRIGLGLGDYGSLGDNQLLSGRSSFPVEAPMTLNDTWGYKFDDHNWKSASEIACTLASTIACDANLLLNIGPRPDGRFPMEARNVLARLADWRKRTGFIIQGTDASPFPQNLPWGWCTVAPGNVLQLVVRPDWNGGALEIAGIRNRILSCSMPHALRDGVLVVRLPPTTTDKMPRVVKVALDGVPDVEQLPMPQNGVMILFPQSARLHCGSSDRGKSVLGAAAEQLVENQMAFGKSGTVTSWHHPGDRITWKVRFPSAGRYRVEMETVSIAHGEPWIGGRKVAFLSAGQRIERGVTLDKSLSSSLYASGVTELGELIVEKAGVRELTIETLSADEVAQVMDLASLRLERRD